MLHTVSLRSHGQLTCHTNYIHVYVTHTFFMCSMMVEQCRRKRLSVGFLDPHIVSARMIAQAEAFVADYVINALLAQDDKEFILFPYNQA